MGRDYSDTLRALGRFLDEEAATGIKVVDAGESLVVSWRGRQGAPEERGYRSFDLDMLRDRARLMRSGLENTPSEGMSENMRALGWVLDQMGADLVSVHEEGSGLRLIALMGGRRASRTYSAEDLQGLVQQQRQGRGRGRAPLAARALGPIPEDD